MSPRGDNEEKTDMMDMPLTQKSFSNGDSPPDFIDDPIDILPSFEDIKRRTTLALYTTGDGSIRDKSPKGSVDEAIRPLVDMINHHPSFSTLSSCSGRIALFDPSNSNEETLGDQADLATTAESGKGRGKWLMVSHEEVQPSTILDHFTDQSCDDEPAINLCRPGGLVLKLEPMLLHVAARTHQRGRQLLALALGLGFRESGLVVPNRQHRITVAIRGNSLALTVPLARKGPLRPPDAYLIALMEQANSHLKANLVKLDELYQLFKTNLFVPPMQTTPLLSYYNNRPPLQPTATSRKLPQLNLWGHSSVLVERLVNKDETTLHSDLLVFGGYGNGIASHDDDATHYGDQHKPKKQTPCQRSSHVYALEYRMGRWADSWRAISCQQVADEISQKEIAITMSSSLEVDATPCNFTAREGLTALVLPLHYSPSLNQQSPIVGLWGGRQSPNRPSSDDLILFQLAEASDTNDHSRFVRPTDTRGQRPEPRWGHSFTALSGHMGHLAVVLGGRNETFALNSIHVLSFRETSNQSDNPQGRRRVHFLWESVLINLTCSLPFHHSAVCVVGSVDDDLCPNRDTIFVFGGLVNPSELLETFSEEYETPHSKACLCIELSNNGERQLVGREMEVKLPTNMLTGIGSHASLLQHFSNGEPSEPGHLMLLSGGITPMGTSLHQSDPNAQSNPIQLIRLCPIGSTFCESESKALDPIPPNSKAKAENFEWKIAPYDLTWLNKDSTTTTLPVLVNHCASSLPPQVPQGAVEVAFVGGGVMGFAFGPCFSRSFCIHLQFSKGIANASHLLTKVSPAVPPSEQTPTREKSTLTDVLYVSRQNAKSLKTQLEKLNYLDKSYRMRKVDKTMDSTDSKREICVPITRACLDLFVRDERQAWMTMVEGIAKEDVPYSTAQFAKKGKQ